MPQSQAAPYGSWKSPITSDLIVKGSIGLAQVALDGEDIYWVEVRPQEGGRSCIVRRTPDGETRDVTPEGFNARTRVHEYGGGDFLVADGTIYFSNFADQQLYRQRTADSEPEPLTPEAPMRYADAVLDRKRNRLVCVREDHTSSEREATNSIASINLDGETTTGVVLVSGPRLLRIAAREPGRQTPFVAGVESSQHALGRVRAVAW